MQCLGKENRGNQTLQRIAEQLQCYKGPKRSKEIEQNSIDTGSGFRLMEAQDTENKQFSCANGRDRRAAVLICLFQGYEGELRVILTRRSMKLASHPGDVALPGGKMEEGDVDDSATALREAMEEIGLDSNLVQVVANLEPFISQKMCPFMLNELRVVPVVGLLARIEDFRPVLNADEVEAVFDAPLEMFLKEENHRCEERSWKGWKYVLHCFDFESEKGDFLICGLTASILI
ncbi:hypothetical protein SLA2020_385430 [Shorea laevis]